MMKRRLFIRISMLALSQGIYGSCNQKKRSYNIRVFSDMEFGHLLKDGHSFQKGPQIQTNTLIVGGGISGMTAAYHIRDTDFILCELSDQLGGTSTAVKIEGSYFSQGAHYDLEYPDNYGNEGLELLKELKIIRFNEFRKLWEFIDRQFIINKNNETQCFEAGSYREDILPDNDIKNHFIQLVQKYKNEMIMPTRLIKSTYHGLNDISFSDFLKNELFTDPSFLKGIDYQMRDDYGGTSDQVSALAGIHYYQCRPYYIKPVEVFSPPQGNYYFIQKLIQGIPLERIRSGQLVYQIHKIKDGFNIKALDKRSRRVINYRARNIIYAGNKHTLKYTFPDDYSLFEKITYAPWVVMNIILKENFAGNKYWQNEIMSGHPSLIGFVDSGAQYTQSDRSRVLTVYFCLAPDQRNVLAELNENREIFCNQVIPILNQYFEMKIDSYIHEIFIRIFGHAMPKPVTGYLFQDQNESRSCENLVYAGVDNHRLPLFFEALDSGIQAGKLIANR